MITPELFDLIRMPEGGAEALPRPTSPYYVLTQDGLYIHKSTAIGTALLPIPPKELPLDLYPGLPTEIVGGAFWHELPLLPPWLIGQTYDWFVKVYNEHKTEAEVLITYNKKTEQFRLFIPWQRANGGGVRSIHDGTHISKGWQLIGTIHSHCNFSAFHSGTDTADASEFPGLHITIGDILKDKPSFDAMVMINGKKFTHGIEQVADLSRLKDFPAPTWWDRYIIAHGAPIPNIRSITEADIARFNGIGPIWAKNNVQHQPKPAYSWVPRPNERPNNPEIWSHTTNRWDYDDDSTDSMYEQWLKDSGGRITQPLQTGTAPPVDAYRPGTSYSSQLGGYVRKGALNSISEINHAAAPEAFYDRLMTLRSLAEFYGINLEFDLTDPGGYTYIVEVGNDLVPGTSYGNEPSDEITQLEAEFNSETNDEQMDLLGICAACGSMSHLTFDHDPEMAMILTKQLN